MGISQRQYDAMIEARKSMTDAEWRAAWCITVLPSGTMIRWSCNGNPYPVERDGGRTRDIVTTEAVRAELDAMGVRRPGDPQDHYVSPATRRLARDLDREAATVEAQDSALRAQGYTDEEIDDLDRHGMIDDDGNVAEE